MCHRRTGLLATVLLALAFVFALSTPALGAPVAYTPEWGNGGSLSNAWHCGHGWITANAVRMAARHGAGWVNIDLAVNRSLWPDLVFNDHIDHNYNRWGDYPSPYNPHWGTRFGNPQVKVQYYYNLTVAALRRGDKAEASRNIGLAAHYLEDVHQPMHTQESALEGNENHFAYERAVDTRLQDSYDEQGWIHDDGYQYVPNASAFTVACAVRSHGYYSSLVSNWAYHGFNSTVSAITAASLDHAVNDLSDLIVSAQSDADQVSANIDIVDPSSSTTGQPVLFAGHGYDPRHAINAWQWRSSVNGLLSTDSAFSVTGLSIGIHTIYFEARCANGKWSPEASTPFVVGAEGTKPLPVYRFYNVRNGAHFYTASEAERRNVTARLSGTYRLEGVCYAIDTSSTANNTPLYRFYNFRQGVHFYTASAAERDSIIARQRATFRYEGVGYYFVPPW